MYRVLLAVSLVLFMSLIPPVAAGAAGPKAPALSAESIAVRTRVFGVETVDRRTGQVGRDRVVLSWFGVAGYAASFRGHVVLLDAWVPRGEYSGYVPVTPEELAALRPEYVFIGHVHFDHAADL